MRLARSLGASPRGIASWLVPGSLGSAFLAALVAGGIARGQNPLVAHYNFDDSANTYTTGGTIFDVSGNGLNGTVINAPLTHNLTGGVSGGSMNAVSSGSASFTTSYTGSPVAADDFTMMFWVKAGAPAAFLDFGQINFSNGTSGQLRTTSTNREFYFRHVTTSSNATVTGGALLSGGAAIVDNSGSGTVWKQVAFMANASTGEFGWYVDGGTPLFTAFPATNNPFTPDTTVSGLRIGRSNQANSRTGQIDEVQLYDRSLTQTEVQLLFANPGYGGTNFRVWDPAAASNSWTAAADWQGLGTAASPGVTGDAASTNADVAILKDYAFSGGLGIDMSAAGANGSLALGGISFDSASGPLRIGNSAADTAGTLRLNGGLVNSVANTVLSVSGSSDLTIGNTASGSGTQTMGLTLTAASNVMNVAADRTLTIESAISQSGGGSSIQKTGSGRLVLSGVNTYTEGTIISGGTLSVADIADSGSSNIGITGGANSRLSIVGGTLEYTGAGSQSTSRAVWADSGSAEINVTQATGSLTLSPVSGTRSAPFTKSGSGSLVMNGDFSGAATVNVTAGTLTLGAANTHSGSTTLASGATLEVAVGDGLQNSPLSAPAGSNVSLTATPGTAYTIGSIAGAATLDATGSSLTVGSTNASTTYSGAITATSLTKQGTGTLTLSGSNTLGGVTVQGGLIVAASNNAVGSGPLTLSGGSFRYAGNATLTNDVTLSGTAAATIIDFGIDSLEYLVVGGGGGGGGGTSNVSYPAGGGGGQVLTGTGLQPNASTLSVTVGAGGGVGVGSGVSGAVGGSSSILSVTAVGGVGGGTVGPGVGGASGSGNAGGANLGTTAAGGGGGQEAVGQQGISSPRRGGHGGAGLISSLTGSELMYGFGGGGGAPSTAGLSLNGDGTSTNPRANSGGGGRITSGPSATTGIGADGVVVVRYAGEPVATGGTIDSSSVPGYTLHTFTADGTLDFSAARTISGVIGGTGGFTFDSAGTLELTGNNTYQGGTIVSRGTLKVGSATALGTGPLTVASGGTVAFDAPGVSSHSLPVVSGAGTLSAAGKTLTFGTGDTSSSFSGSVTAATLAKEGTGQLALAGSNTLGGTTLSAGTLVAAANDALGSGAVTISGGTLRAVAGTTLANPITLSVNASSAILGIAAPELEYLVVGGGGGPGGGVSGQSYNGGGGGGDVQTGTFVGLTNAAFDITVGAGGGLSTAGGSSSAFGVTASGGGEGVVSGVGGTSGSGFPGAARAGVEAGGGGGAGGAGLQGVGSGSRIGGDGGPGLPSDITGSTVYYGGGGAGGGGGNGPGTGGLGGGAGRNGDATPNSGGGGRGAGTGGFADAAGADGVVIVRYAGSQAATGGTVDTESVPGYTLHTFTSVGSQTLSFSNFATTLAGDISGTGGFTWDSVGTLTLTGTNSYAGDTIVAAGRLNAGSATAFGSGTITLASGTTLDLGGFAVGNTIVNNGGTILNAGSYTGNQTVDGDASFDGNVSGTVVIGNGGVGRFRGQVEGRLEVAAGGVAELDDAASVGGSATFVNDGILRANRSTDLSIGRPISGTGSFEKRGAGRVTLSGANTYTGGTTVDAGALVVNGSILGNVALAAGSRLGGSGSIGGTVGGAGVFGPGNSPGLTTVGSIDPSGGLSFEIEITGTLADWDSPTASINDVIRLTDATPFTTAMTAGNTISILLDVAGADPAASGTYTGGFFTDTAADFSASIANASFEYWVAGEFGSLGDRQQFATGAGGTLEWYTRLSAYDSGLSVQWSTVPTTADFGSGPVSGYTTEFVVVPEPGTLALAGLGLAAFLARRLFRPRLEE